MGDAVAQVEARFNEEIDSVSDAEMLEAFRVRWFGDKAGLINKGVASWVRELPRELKPVFGKQFKNFAGGVERTLNERRFEIERGKDFHSSSQLQSSNLDLSLPGIRRSVGVEHPLTRTMREMVAVFAALGYSVGVGPEVETDFYNFEALNFPPNHPARDTQDTLVVADQESKPLRERYLMRTHTSPVQIRSMVANDPPLRLVIPGKVHRNDESDATHSPIFHQVEGLCVDRGITFSDLKGTLDHAMKAFFGSSVKTRFFPSFFPFTEPSADVQISCPFCGGNGCRKCKWSGWIELLGCGMVDPAVFQAVDARRVENGLAPAFDVPGISGFAFGMGVERIAMMKYGVGDIGQFYSGDLRFLDQFL
ncbi:phenylalanine--tRNA ligase subunit alpha [Terriglobus sp.]|uniref:phenylalanine--tRNA ligase subunit alpha n=1 Tax=Terriglobus sp. TaxID=1889013 RepID=UPI003B0049A4